MSSHILSEVQAVCDKIVVINQGKIVANDTAENLSTALAGEHKLSVKIDGPAKEIKELIEGILGVIKVSLIAEKNDYSEFVIESEENKDIRRELFTRMAGRNWYIIELKTSEMSLEDIFLRLTMGEKVELKGGTK